MVPQREVLRDAVGPVGYRLVVGAFWDGTPVDVTFEAVNGFKGLDYAIYGRLGAYGCGGVCRNAGESRLTCADSSRYPTRSRRTLG